MALCVTFINMQQQFTFIVQHMNWAVWLSLQMMSHNRTRCDKTAIGESYSIQYASQQLEFQFEMDDL